MRSLKSDRSAPDAARPRRARRLPPLFSLLAPILGAGSLQAATLQETPVDRVIQYTESTESYALWDAGWTTLPVGGLSGGRETRALLKFDFADEWRSAAGTAESIILRLVMTSRSGSHFDVEVVALEEHFDTPIRTGDFRAAGRVVWGPVSTASLTTGAPIEIDVTDPVRRMGLRGNPAAFRIQAADTTPVIGTNNTAVFAGAKYATTSRRPLLRYDIRSPMAAVANVQAGTISPADLSPQEQNIADYVGTVSRLANLVEDEDLATYGFITGSMWRVPKNEPYNARVQENAMTMAWFYSKPRPWNPYFGDRPLRHRMEAALAYLITLQKEDGHFPEFPPDVQQTGNHKRAPTSFILFYIAHILQVLEEGPGINEDLRAELVNAAERAAGWFLNETTDVWTTGRWVSNQLPPGLLGIHMLRAEFSEDFRALWDQRLTYTRDHAQSPGGFFYESHHVGHNYSFSVMTRDMALFYEATGDARVLEMQEKYLEWLGYNFLPEPDGIGFFINSAIDARHTGFNHIAPRDVGANNLWSASLPAAAAFGRSREEVESERSAFLESDWNGTSFLTRWVTPAVMVDIEYPEHYVTAEEREAAIAALPPVREERFTEFRRDSYREFLFTRRPGYYVAANLGNRNTPHQRMGLSLFWHPRLGSLVQSQDVDNVSWSAIHSGDLASAEIDADGNLPARYWRGNEEIDPATLSPLDDFSFTYIGTGGSKRVSFFDDRVERTVQIAGQFREQVPLIIRPTDHLSWIGSDDAIAPGQSTRTASATGLRLEREGHFFEIDWGERRVVQFGTAPSGSFFSGERRLHRLTIVATDSLTYSLAVRPMAFGFSRWQGQHFSAEELAEPTVSGPLADPAGDQVANLVKYLLGLAPWSSARHALPAPAIDEEHLSLRFTRDPAADDLIWTVEASDDAVHWQAGGEAVTVAEEPAENGAIRVTARDREPASTHSRRFLRLVVAQER